MILLARAYFITAVLYALSTAQMSSAASQEGANLYTLYGDATKFDIPDQFDSLSESFRKGGENFNKVGVVIGAGPAGLAAAIALRKAGFDEVFVADSRRTFARMNVINLNPDALHGLARLGVEDAIIKRASKIDYHQGHIYVQGQYFAGNKDTLDAFNPKADFEYEPENLAEIFNSPTLYSLPLAEVQDELTKQAMALNVKIVGGSDVSLHEDNGAYDVSVCKENLCFEVKSPDLVVLADGASSRTARTIGIQRSRRDYHEAWCFGNVGCEVRSGLVGSTIDYDFDTGEIALTNSIFHRRLQEVNVSVGVDPEYDLTVAEIKSKISAHAMKICKLEGLQCAGDPIWVTSKKVNIFLDKSLEMTKGSNVILIGDAAGSGSPLAGLGSSLAVSAYPYAITKLIEESETVGRTDALTNYTRRAGAYVDRWHNKTAHVKEDVIAGALQEQIRAGWTAKQDQAAM